MDKATRVIKRGAAGAPGPREQKAETGPGRPGREYFVGRRQLLEKLYNNMARAAATRSLRLVSVTGPAGIGKSRLMTELASILMGRSNPVKVYRVQLADTSAQPVIAQLLRTRFNVWTTKGSTPLDELDRLQLGMSDLVPPDNLDEATRLIASMMRLTVDNLGRPLPGFEPAVIRSKQFRQRAVQTALNLMRYDIQSMPHLVIFDDWDRAARPADLEMAETMLRLVSAAPLCVAVLSESPLNPPIDLPAPAESMHIELGPLEEKDMTRLVTGLLENVVGLPDSVITDTVAQANGSPSMGEELVRLLTHREVIKPRQVPGQTEQQWTFQKEKAKNSKRFPKSLDESVRERLSGFPAHERGILEAASVMGSVFWVRGIVSLLRASPDSPDLGVHLDADPFRMKVEGTLMTLVERGVFRQVDETLIKSQAGMEFTSAAMRETAYSSIEPEPRARLHRLAAQWLNTATPVELLPWLEMRAAHAETGRLGREAAALYLEAGDLAHAINNPGKAVDLYRRGLSLVQEDSAEVACELLDRLARTYIETSDYAEADICLIDGLAFATILDDEVRSGHALLLMGHVLRARGQYDQARLRIEHAAALFERAKQRSGSADALEALATLVSQQGHKGALELALHHLEAALKIRREVGKPLQTARTMTVLANVKYSTGELDDAMRIHQEALSIREQLGDRRGQLLSLNGLGVARYDNGQHDEAVALWQRALVLASELGDRAQHTMLLMNLGEESLEAGRLEESGPRLKQALQTAEELGLQRLAALALTLLSSLELARGSEAVALTLAEKALDHGYAIESKQVLGHALMAKARAMSNALFIDGQDDDERMRSASESYQKAITLLEEMGERPTLVRALDAYGTFLLERGVKNKGRKAIERAEALRNEMRSPEQQQKAFHEARTIRRQYQTGPIETKDIDLMLDLAKWKR